MLGRAGGSGRRRLGTSALTLCVRQSPYVEWGMADPSLPLLSVSNSVDIDVATAGRVTWATPGPAGPPANR
jgi:hypothetical protein